MVGEAAVLVSAGEASGDRFAAGAVRALGRPSFGLGGPALEAAGCHLVERLERVTGTGLGPALVAAPRLARAALALAREAGRRRVRAALLVDFTEFHYRLGPLLRRRGVRVLWAVAPQVWAWRPGRVTTLAPAADRLALLFPFETPLWRRAGLDAHWVGHPAADAIPAARADARASVGLPAGDAPALALLPGSRPNEVGRLLPAMLGAFDRARARLPGLRARVLVAPSLPATLARAVRRRAEAHGAPALEVDAARGLPALLPAFDAAVCASGTATLEAALCGVPPVITYRLGPASAAVARFVLRGGHVGLPNVVLGEGAYPELLQGDANAPALARAAVALLTRPPPSREAGLRAYLRPPGDGTAASRTAALLAPWL
jgi:lipid-A-disaccharide synthase